MIYFKYNIYITKNHLKVRSEDSGRFLIFLLRSVSGRKLDPTCFSSFLEAKDHIYILISTFQ